jgi:hypothetical protein
VQHMAARQILSRIARRQGRRTASPGGVLGDDGLGKVATTPARALAASLHVKRARHELANYSRQPNSRVARGSRHVPAPWAKSGDCDPIDVRVRSTIGWTAYSASTRRRAAPPSRCDGSEIGALISRAKGRGPPGGISTPQSPDSPMTSLISMPRPAEPRPLPAEGQSVQPRLARWGRGRHPPWRGSTPTAGITAIERVQHPGEQAFTKLYSDVPGGGALIQVPPHPTPLYNTQNGAPERTASRVSRSREAFTAPIRPGRTSTGGTG